ncbi:MAG: glycosyl hydrolase family 18 protein [Spirochaetia bacterium]
MNASRRPLLGVLAAACTLVAGCATSPAFTPIPIVGQDFRIPPDFRIVGYFPSWSGQLVDIQFSALTHVNYAFLEPNSRGGYEPVANPEKLDELVAFAHAYGVKVLASLGGASDGKTDAFKAICTDTGLASVFIDSTLSLVDEFQLDGIDMDWEYPGLDSADEYAALMHSLAAKLHDAGKLLTAAVSADASHGTAIRDSVIADADFLNVMAYDDGYRQPGVHHSTYEFALAAMHYWRYDRDAPASKIVLGVPFYGRSLKDRHSRTFKSIRAADPDAPGKDVSGEFGYNGFATLRDKTLRLARNLGSGIMIWQIAQDAPGTTSLLNAIFDAVKVPREKP